MVNIMSKHLIGLIYNLSFTYVCKINKIIHIHKHIHKPGAKNVI